MKTANLTKNDTLNYQLSGELTMQNVPLVAKETAAMVNAMQGDIVINLSAVSRADSAGLALLIDWLRTANQRGFSIKFEGLPAQLKQIARISELDQILPLNEQKGDSAHHSGHH